MHKTISGLFSTNLPKAKQERAKALIKRILLQGRSSLVWTFLVGQQLFVQSTGLTTDVLQQFSNIALMGTSNATDRATSQLACQLRQTPEVQGVVACFTRMGLKRRLRLNLQAHFQLMANQKIGY